MTLNRPRKLKTSHTLLKLYGGYATRLPHIHPSTLKKIVIGTEMLETTCQIKLCHISEDRHLNARFVLHWVRHSTLPAILPYLHARRTARGKQAICRSSIPSILSCQPQTKLRTEETSRLFDQITLFSK